MPKINVPSAACVERAAELHKKHPTLSVLQLMKLTNFSAKEQECCAMWTNTYCCIKKKTMIPQQSYVFMTTPPA